MKNNQDLSLEEKEKIIINYFKNQNINLLLNAKLYLWAHIYEDDKILHYCTKEFVKFINGEKILQGSFPYSMAYAGHQFGYFVPQLGDGRAINLGSAIGSTNNWHLQTKGSGRTKYSRQGDGRAVLRSSIREYIMSEAMHGLGIPTTRALAIIGSQEEVLRSYDEIETGAIVLRMSPSWIRIGTFEFQSSDPISLKPPCLRFLVPGS